MIIVAFVVSVIVALTLSAVVSTWVVYCQSDLPRIPSPPSRWISGHLQELRKPSFHRILSLWAKEYGSIFR